MMLSSRNSVLFMDCYQLGRQVTATKGETRANRGTCQEEGYVGQEVRNPTEGPGKLHRGCAG